MGDHLLLNPMTLIVWWRGLRLRREAIDASEAHPKYSNSATIECQWQHF
jgi:hypothetical protein